MGETATFWVEGEVSTGAGAKAVFDGWTGGTNGTVMNAPLTVTANWHNEYLVTVVSEHGTVPEPQWIVEGGTYSLTIEDMEEDVLGTTRWLFDGWTTPDTANGGYDGDSRQVQLTVNGPITETAVWKTQYYLTIVSIHLAEPLEVLGNPTGEGWYDEGAVATVSVDKTDEIGDYIYTFKQWSGDVTDAKSPVTMTTMNSPKILTVEWSRQPKFSIMDLWWLFLVIIIIVVVIVAVLLLRKKKPAEEEIPPPVEEEEIPEEQPPAPPSE